MNFYDNEDYLERNVDVIIDRPLGSKHPNYDMIYPINYGYIPNTISGDGEELDAYILGIDEPIEKFSGKCIGIIHRINDNDDKLIISNNDYSNLQIEKIVNFQERYFKHIIIRKKIIFSKLTDDEKNYKKIYKWCQNKIVYEWFEQRKLSFEEIKEKYHNKIISKKQDLFIINYDNKDIGLVQIYKYDGNIINAFEYDLFIGEIDYLGKGVGTIIVNLINEKIFNEYMANSIILRPFKRNIRACNCYKNSGFRIIREYDDVDTLGNKETIVEFIKNRGE